MLLYINAELFDRIWEIFSVVWFSSMLTIFYMLYFSNVSIRFFQKYASCLGTLVLNILISVGFVWQLSIPLSIFVSLLGLLVINRMDVKITYENELRGGYYINKKKREQQMNIFKNLSPELQEIYRKAVPPIEKFRVHPMSFLTTTLLLPITLSLVEKVLYQY